MNGEIVVRVLWGAGIVVVVLALSRMVVKDLKTVFKNKSGDDDV